MEEGRCAFLHSSDVAIVPDHLIQLLFDLIFAPRQIVRYIMSLQFLHWLPGASMNASFFLVMYSSELISFCRTQEPTADNGVSPLRQLERLSHQTQGPL